MTFFRHFPDKREVLFAGQDVHSRLLADAIAAVPGPSTPLAAVAAALDAITATFADDHREFAARLRAVIAANSELRERAAFKRTGLTEAMTESLAKRGVPDLTASLAAELGIRAYYRAFDQWADPTGQQTLTDLTRRALDELRAATATLG
jgi:AcrR family transcriptional regulator